MINTNDNPVTTTISFKNGIHPEEFKEITAHSALERMPFVDEYTLPLSQHIGAPSKAIVKKGQKVHRGEMIAESEGYVSVALHSPVTGTVSAVDLFNHPNGQALPAIRIKADPFSPQEMIEAIPIDVDNMDMGQFIKAVQTSGLVGLGGAAFPAHVKFAIPPEKTCKYLMINGCECEPFLTSDHRIMLEYPKAMIDGIRILQYFLKVEKIFIGVEINKSDAIRVLNEEAKASELPIEIIPLKVKYPQGAEKMLITAVLEKEVPSGKLPLDVETLVSNVGTIVALSHYFRRSEPLTERVITVTGTAIRRPANLMIPIGTPIREVVDFCGGVTEDASRFLLGGPMMGIVQKSLDIPVMKGTSSILILTENEVLDMSEYSCIRCSRCLEACPLFLNPSLLGLLSKNALWDEMEENNVMDCFECAACSYVCPSGIPLVQNIRVGKGMIRKRKIMELHG